MADTYSIAFKADTRDVRTARKDIDRLGRTVKSGGESVERFGRQVKKSNTQTQSMARASRLAARAVTALGTAISVQQVAGQIIRFDEALASVKAITNATASEMVLLEASARDLGATTRFSASQVAEAFRFLGMAGFTVQESLESVQTTLDLATASQMELGQTADILSNILSGFGLAADQAVRAGDVLAATASNANTNVEQLGNAMSYAAPVAASLGVSIEQTSSAIAILSNAGIQGQKAGTGLRAAFLALAAPSNQAEAALESLGLSLSDVDLQSRSVAEVFSTLQAAGLDASRASQIFGREASSAALTLARASKETAQFTQNLGSADGELQRMADTMNDTLMGDIRNFLSAMESISLNLGDEFMPAMRGTVQSMTDFARIVADNAGFVADLGRAVATLMAMKLAGWAYGAAAGFVALNGAAVTLTSTLRFLGGPAGLLVGTAIAVKSVADEFNEARNAAKYFGDELDTLSARQMRAELETLETVLYRLQTEENRDPYFFVTDNHREKIRLTEDRIAALKARLDEIRPSAERLGESLEEMSTPAAGPQVSATDALITGPEELEHINLIEQERVRLLERMGAQFQGINMLVEETTYASYNLNDALRSVGNALRQVERTIETGIGNALEDMIMRGESAREVFQQLARDIAAAIMRQQLINPAAQAITGAITGFFPGGGAPPAGATSSQMSNMSFLPGGAAANGGNAFRDRAMLVGERGPEVFIPGQDGRIIPNHQMGGSANVTVNIINEGGESMTSGSQQSRRGPNGETIIDVMVKSSMERLDSQGQLDGIFRRHGAARQGQF